MRVNNRVLLCMHIVYTYHISAFITCVCHRFHYFVYEYVAIYINDRRLCKQPKQSHIFCCKKIHLNSLLVFWWKLLNTLIIWVQKRLIILYFSKKHFFLSIFAEEKHKLKSLKTQIQMVRLLTDFTEEICMTMPILDIENSLELNMYLWNSKQVFLLQVANDLVKII